MRYFKHTHLTRGCNLPASFLGKLAFRSILALLGLSFCLNTSDAQTVLIDPAGNGGFESGGTPAANNWTVVNSTVDSWIVGTGSGVSAGINSAYTSSTPSGIMDWSYSQLSTIQHLYYDVTIPAGESKVTLLFKWKVGGEGTTTSDWDNMKVFWGLASGITPVANTAISSTFQVSGPGAVSGMYKLNSAAYNAETIIFAGVPGSTYRLVFSWKSDGSTIAPPPAAIDEVSLVSSIPGNFVSAATGDWNVGATWVGGVAPSAVDNATITAGHTVSINAASLAINNLTVDGTLQYTTTPTSFTVNGNISVSATGVFNVFFAPTTGKTLIARGNITNDGTIDLSKTSAVLQLTGTAPQTVSGAGTFTNSTITGLTFNNTSTTYPSITWGVNGIMVSGTTAFTAGRVAITGNWLSCGIATATGTLTVGSGGILSGTFGRGQATASTGSAITAGADPTTVTSRYPFINSLGQNRSAWFERTTPTGAGILGVTYTEAAGFTGVSIADANPAYTVEQRTNENWSASILAGTLACASIEFAVVAPNIFGPAPPVYPRLVMASAVAGTNQAGSTTPGGQRNFTGGTALADLTGGALYLGLNNADFPNISIANGNWNSAATWSKGTVPTCSDNVYIIHSVTINSAGLVAKGVNIGPSGVLTMTSGDLTVDACTPRADAIFAIGAGTFDMQGGTLTVNGSFRTLDTSTGVFKQSGGTIIVDGNNGVALESVATHIADFFCNNLSHLQLTGGTFIVVDPPASTTTTNAAFKVFPSSASGFAPSSGSAWNLTFGNGTQTNNGGHTNGYLINLANTNSFKIAGTLTNNATIGAGTNRHISTSGNLPIGNLVINSGTEYRTGSTHFISGDITNNGTMVASSTVTFSDFSANAGVVGNTPQTIGGTGTFNNSTTTVTANFTSITVNNNGGVTLAVPLTMSGTLLMTKGIIYTSATNNLRLGTITAVGTLSASSVFGDETYIEGPFLRTFGTVATSTNSFTNTHLWPLGKGGKYFPIWLNPQTTAAGTIFTGEAFGTNSGTAGSGVTNLSNTTWSIIPNTTANLTNVHVQLGDVNIGATNQILQAPNLAGAYNGIVTGTLYAAGTPVNTLKTNPNGSPIPTADFTGYFAYGDLTPCVVPTAQPTSLNFVSVGATTLTVNFTAASPVADAYLVVRYLTGGTETPPVNTTQYSVGGALGTGTVVAVGSATTFNQTGLTANQGYDYYVYSFNNIGCGGGPIYLTTSPLFGTVTTCNTPAIGAPTSFVNTARSQTTLDISWTASSTPGVTYEVDVATNSAFTDFIQYANNAGAGTTYTVTGLSPQTTYYMRVRAYDSATMCYSTNLTGNNSTLCLATTVPYTENLNSSTICLTVLGTGVGNNWSLGSAPTTPSGMSGQTARIASSTTLTTNSYFVTRALSLTGGTSYDVMFKYGNTTTNPTLSLETQYNANISTSGGTTIATLANINNTAAQTATLTFVPSTTGDYYILIRANGPVAGTTSTVHIDDIEVVETPTCSAASGGTITSSYPESSACGNSNSTDLAATGFSTGLGISYQWQRSNDNFVSNIVDISGATNPFSATGTFLSGYNYFRLKVECSFGSLVGYSNVVGPISYTNAQLVSTTPGSRCGIGTVTLGATANPGDEVSWYEASTGGASLGVGTSFITPVINSTTNYYAAAVTPVPGSNITQGAGATTSATYSNPFYSLWSNTHTQHLITAAELSASGLFAGPINSVALNITSAGTLPMIDLSVKIGHTTTTNLTVFDNNAGFSTIYTNASLMPVVGVNTLVFSSPFVWDGTSNIILEFCHGNSGSTATMSRTCRADNTSYNSSIKVHVSAATSAATICADVTTNLLTYTVRPQFIFNGVGACEGTRTAVTATVSTPPALTLSAASSTICQGTPSSLVTVTSTVGDYDTYTWAPLSGVSGTPGAGYTFNPSTSTNYTLTASQTGGSMCVSTVAHNVTVNPVPTSVIATATPSEVCSGDNSQLNVTVAGLPGTIKISEVTLFRTGTGQTVSYPAYATGADLVEITNTSSNSVDISGWILQDFADNATTASHAGFAFPSGTIIPANSFAIVCLGTGTDDIPNRYFNTGGTSDSWSSGGLVGIVLKNGSTIVDAVGLNSGYDFNAATGVTASDWSGFAPSASGIAGTIRSASVDSNTGADWIQSSAGTPQTIGTYNSGYAGGASITSYAWSPATFLSATNIANPVATAVTASTTYSVVVTTNAGCTVTSNNVPVTVVTGAGITTHPSNVNGCMNGTANFAVVATGPGLTYQWRKNSVNLMNGGNISGATTANLMISSLTGADADIYDVIVTSTCGSPVTSNTATLVVNALPTVAVSPTSATFCTPSGTPVTLTASGAVSYTWSPSPGLSGTTGTSVTASPSTSTLYTVTGTDANSCTNTATSMITASLSPSVTISPASATINCGDVQALAVMQNASANLYDFSGLSGTFTALSGGTAVDVIEDDDVVSSAIPIGFSFTFEGTTFTDVIASSNGWLSFNASAGTATAAEQRTNVSTAPAVMLPLLAPLWDDLDGFDAPGAASYLTTGSAPNRVFTFEWLDWEWNWQAGAAVISFQVKLYEGSNKVEFIYRDDAAAVNAGGASVGIITSSSNYKMLDGTGAAPNALTSTFTTNLNVEPSTGRVYTFERPTSSFLWSPSAGLYQDMAATVLYTNQNLATVYAKPNSNTTYTVTATNANSCIGTAQASVNVNGITYYQDSDGDTYGNNAVTAVACTAPMGYVADNTDCDDNDITVHSLQLYYVDNDMDGFGSTTTAMLCSSTAPVGYSTNNTDCNDNDNTVNSLQLYYVDNDMDGFGSATTAMLCSSTAPVGYSTNNTDCNDNDNTVNSPQPYYVDNDMDGFGSTTTAMLCSSTAPVGYSTNNTDCNDSDNTVNTPQLYYVDNDMDGFGSTTTAMLCSSTAPVGYSTNNTDCNDNDNTVNSPQLYYVDNDMDGFGSATTAMLCSSTAPAGYSTNNTDCNDSDNTVNSPQLYYVDSDMDGFGSATTAMLCSSTAPVGYSTNNTDCNDGNAAINPGAAEICNAIDDDCSGSAEAATNTWNGTGNGSTWDDADNWSDGIVPLECQNVVIPTGFNVNVPIGFTGKGLTLDVATGALLTVPVSALLNIQP